MIKLSIFYPNDEGKNFDKEYYINVHMPLSIKLQGEAIKRVEVEFGFSGGMPGSKPTYVAICNFWYDSFEAFENAFMPHADTLMNDIANYTDIKTIIQFSEVKMSL
ncbi:MAG TPA: EthD family reductase [Parafilimonas sp.]|nr:EthD family reductase [Parafilimonas sp.]